MPLLSSGSGDFSMPVFLAANSALSPLERARKSMAQNAAATPPPNKTDKKPHKKHDKKSDTKSENRADTQESAPNVNEAAAKRTATTKRRTGKKVRTKRPPLITATISGLLVSAIILLATTGLYGAYCFSQGEPGDTNVTASTLLYLLAVFSGSFWAAAVVKRQSTAPVVIICATYMVLSLVFSAGLFSVKSFKILMILEKILLTAASGLIGYGLSAVPYLLNRALKHK